MSPIDPSTTFLLERSGTPVDVDGHKLGTPTGEVICAECLRSASNVDHIHHAPDCPQRDARSRWWVETH
jgi:hypothetical protein